MRVNVADIRQQTTMNYLVQGREVIFNLAGQVSHIDSMRDPVHRSRHQLPQPADRARGVPPQQPRRQGRLRGHAPDLRQARLPAGRREPPGAPDRRQRHQQGRRRAVPPRLQQRLRRARLLAAADQHLRPAPADQAQPPGLHRLVHPPHRRGPGDRDLRRRLADARLRLRGRCVRRLPAGRARPTPATAQAFNVGGLEPISTATSSS